MWVFTVTAKRQQLVEEGLSDAAIQTLHSDYLTPVLSSLRSSLCVIQEMTHFINCSASLCNLDHQLTAYITAFSFFLKIRLDPIRGKNLSIYISNKMSQTSQWTSWKWGKSILTFFCKQVQSSGNQPFMISQRALIPFALPCENTSLLPCFYSFPNLWKVQQGISFSRKLKPVVLLQEAVF